MKLNIPVNSYQISSYQTVLFKLFIKENDYNYYYQVCVSPVMQAYGLTETTSSATSQLSNQPDCNTVGSVIPGCEMRLVIWPEAAYRCTEKSNPRGDNFSKSSIVSGTLRLGIWAKCFIGGNLKIIDRKKDSVKLTGGEYVQLNKIASDLVDNRFIIYNLLI